MAETNALNSSAFPDENLTSAEKDRAWRLQYSKAAFNKYGALPLNSIGWMSRSDYDLTKSYASGRQITDKYKPVPLVQDDPTNNINVIDWGVLSIIPKYRRIALELLSKVMYCLRIDPIDPLARGELEDTILEAKAKITVRQQLAMMGMPEFQQNLPVMQEPEEPEDLDGLSAMEMGIRHRTAMEAEQVVELVFNGNDYEAIRREIRKDLFDYGVGIMKDYREGDKVGIRRCDPRRMVISYCSDPQLKDLKYVGEIQLKQAYQIVSDSQGQISKEEIETVWRRGNLNQGLGLAGNVYRNFTDFWNSGQVGVLDLEIYTTDIVEKQMGVNTRGNLVFGSPGEKRKERYKYPTKYVQKVYRVKWIIGTDIIYDDGPQYNMKRDPHNNALCYGSYHIHAIEFHDMRATSFTKALIPFADAIQQASYRLQHALNSVVPSGYKIDHTALEDIDLGAGGSKMTPKDILNLFFSRGILIARSGGLPGQNMPSKEAVTRLEGGVGNEIAEFWTVIQNNIELMRTTLGLNELTDGSTPNPKILTTVANAATAGTNNALGELFYADRFLTQSLAKSVIIRAQDIIRSGDGEGFVQALGAGTVQVIGSIKDIEQYIYGVNIEDLPTDDQIVRFDALVAEALKNGQITIADALQLNNIQNMKQKELFLAYKVKKNMERQQQMKMQEMQQNSQSQIQSAQAAEQARQQTIQLEYDLKLRNDMAVEEAKRATAEMQGNFTLEKERIAASGRVEASFVQATGRDEANMRDNTTDLIKNDKGEAIEVVNIPADLQSRVEPTTTNEQPLLDLATGNRPFSFFGKPQGIEVGGMPQGEEVDEGPESPQVEQQEMMQGQQPTPMEQPQPQQAMVQPMVQ